MKSKPSATYWAIMGTIAGGSANWCMASQLARAPGSVDRRVTVST